LTCDVDDRSQLKLVGERISLDADAEPPAPTHTADIGLPCSLCGARMKRISLLHPGLGPRNSNAVALGRLGGLKGGHARAKALTPQRRQEIARKAAEARWKRNRQ
jgi:hypothetical protein